MRAKFISQNQIETAPKAKEINGEWVIYPSDEMLEEFGYKIVEVGIIPILGEMETLTTTYIDGPIITCEYTVNADPRTTEQKRADYYNSNRERAGWLASATNYSVTGQADKLATVAALIAADNAICNNKYPY